MEVNSAELLSDDWRISVQIDGSSENFLVSTENINDAFETNFDAADAHKISTEIGANLQFAHAVESCRSGSDIRPAAFASLRKG